MTNIKHNRKEFLKKFAFSIADKAAQATAILDLNKETDLIDEQKEFLLSYESWLKEFQKYVDVRKEKPFDIENNKKLMELSAQSEERKSVLELYMKDPKFAEYFNKITAEITNSI